MTHYPFKYIDSYAHDHRIGILVEFGFATELTARVPEVVTFRTDVALHIACLLYTSPSPRDKRQSRMPSSA